MQTKVIFSVIGFLFLTLICIGAYEMTYESIIMGRNRWAWQYVVMGIGAVGVSVFIGRQMYKSLRKINSKAVYGFYAFAIAAAVILMRFGNLMRPSVQATILKKGYLKSIDKDSYSACSACSYNPFFDFFDPNMYYEFKDDTAFVTAYAAVLQVDKPRWSSGGISYASNPTLYTEYTALVYMLWRLQDRKPSDFLKHPNGDALLLAMAFAETREQELERFENNYLEYNYRVIITDGINILRETPPRKYFNQNWLSDTDIVALFRHYLKKDNLSKNELEILLYLTTKFPARFLSQPEFDRLLEQWKKHQEPFVKDIELVRSRTAELRREWASFVNANGKLPVRFAGSSIAEYWTPLLHSMGFEPEEDSSSTHFIFLTTGSKVTLLHEYYQPHYEYQTKERQVYKTGTKYTAGRYVTENYQERVNTGSTLESVYRTDIAFLYSTPNSDSVMFLFELPELLFHPYYDTGTKEYSLDYDYTRRRPWWLYAIPKTFYAYSDGDY